MGAFTLLSFVQPRSFCGDCYFLWRSIMLYYASWFGQNVCRLFTQIYAALRIVYSFCSRLCMSFAYVQVFCVRFCTDFAHILRLLHTNTAYLLWKLCSFCVRIQHLCALRAFVYVYGLSFAMFDADSIEGSDLAGSLISCVCVNALDLWTVSKIRSWGFRRFLFPRELLVIIGQSQGSDVEGSVKFFICASCSWFAVQSYLGGFLLILIELYIFPVE